MQLRVHRDGLSSGIIPCYRRELNSAEEEEDLAIFLHTIKKGAQNIMYDSPKGGGKRIEYVRVHASLSL